MPRNQFDRRTCFLSNLQGWLGVFDISRPPPRREAAVPCSASSRRTQNPGASCAKESRIVQRGPGDPETVFPRARSRRTKMNDSRQRISRLLHR